MTLPPLFEFGPVVAYDSAIDKLERIIFRPTEPINLATYGILVGWQDQNGLITPLKDNFFWFGEIQIAPPCWIVVYTGKGENKLISHHQTGHPVYIFYWGNDTTILNLKETVPVLVRFAGIQIGSHNNPPAAWHEFEAQLSVPSTPALQP